MIPPIPNIPFSNSNHFFLIAGPCVVESEEVIFNTARELKRITEDHHIPFIFKSSYEKANRTRSDSFAGLGDVIALKILKEVGEKLSLPTLTDIHDQHDAPMVAEYVDVLQIPAFLCRQTDLLLAAAKTGKFVNIKKGQFLAPDQMVFAANKVKEGGNNQIMLTERGTTFGYQDLVVDFRSIPAMKKIGYPVVLDCTHSLQKPNQAQGITGGTPQLIEIIARAGIAAGVDGLF